MVERRHRLALEMAPILYVQSFYTALFTTLFTRKTYRSLQTVGLGICLICSVPPGPHDDLYVVSGGRTTNSGGRVSISLGETTVVLESHIVRHSPISISVSLFT